MGLFNPQSTVHRAKIFSRGRGRHGRAVARHALEAEEHHTSIQSTAVREPRISSATASLVSWKFILSESYGLSSPAHRGDIAFIK